MSASGNVNTLFDLKSASLTLVAFVLRTANLPALEKAMEERFADTPDFFGNDPVVVDLSHLASLDLALPYDGLIALLRRFRLNPVAVRGANPAQTEAALAAGLVEAPESQAPARVETIVKEVIREVPVEVRVEVPVGSATVIVDKPLRSGQQVYAKGGDLIVLAAVNNGAEVIADGHIHVYAPLRGKAIAGAKGNTEARIFAAVMEPELISIAGTYRTTDNPLPPDVVGRPAQIRLEGERLVYEALKL